MGFLVLCSHQVSSSHRKTNLLRVATKKNVYTIAPSLTRGLKYECYIQVIFQGSAKFLFMITESLIHILKKYFIFKEPYFRTLIIFKRYGTVEL